MAKVVPIEDGIEHNVCEVICVKCGKRWISVYPTSVLLKEIICPVCGAGFVIKTGQELGEE